MMLSEIGKQTLMDLPYTRKWDIVCGTVKDEGQAAEAALLLGSRPVLAAERARAAARLFHAGRVKLIVPSGGVEWDVSGERISEADYMTRILREEGIPASAICPDNDARTTKENMLFGTVKLLRRSYDCCADRVIIVTCLAHTMRSMALARALLPRKTAVFAFPAIPALDRDAWLDSKENQAFLDNELRLLKELIDMGEIEDIKTDPVI